MNTTRGVAVILPLAYVSYLEHQILYAYEQILDNEIYIFAHRIKRNLIVLFLENSIFSLFSINKKSAEIKY